MPAPCLGPALELCLRPAAALQLIYVAPTGASITPTGVSIGPTLVRPSLPCSLLAYSDIGNPSKQRQAVSHAC